MENIKDKMTIAIKKLGTIKESVNYVNTKFTEQDTIDLVSSIAEESSNEFAIRFSEWLPTTKWNKVLDTEDCYLHSVKRIKYNSKQLVELFRKENC